MQAWKKTVNEEGLEGNYWRKSYFEDESLAFDDDLVLVAEGRDMTNAWKIYQDFSSWKNEKEYDYGSSV